MKNCEIGNLRRSLREIEGCKMWVLWDRSWKESVKTRVRRNVGSRLILIFGVFFISWIWHFPRSWIKDFGQISSWEKILMIVRPWERFFICAWEINIWIFVNACINSYDIRTSTQFCQEGSLLLFCFKVKVLPFSTRRNMEVNLEMASHVETEIRIQWRIQLDWYFYLHRKMKIYYRGLIARISGKEWDSILLYWSHRFRLSQFAIRGTRGSFIFASYIRLLECNKPADLSPNPTIHCEKQRAICINALHSMSLERPRKSSKLTQVLQGMDLF